MAAEQLTHKPVRRAPCAVRVKVKPKHVPRSQTVLVFSMYRLQLPLLRLVQTDISKITTRAFHAQIAVLGQ